MIIFLRFVFSVVVIHLKPFSCVFANCSTLLHNEIEVLLLAIAVLRKINLRYMYSGTFFIYLSVKRI